MGFVHFKKQLFKWMNVLEMKHPAGVVQEFDQ